MTTTTLTGTMPLNRDAELRFGPSAGMSPEFRSVWRKTHAPNRPRPRFFVENFEDEEEIEGDPK